MSERVVKRSCASTWRRRTRTRFDRTIATFDHPRYELVATGDVYDGEEARSIYSGRTSDRCARFRRGRAFRCRLSAHFLFEGEHLVCERVYFDQLTVMCPGAFVTAGRRPVSRRWF